MLLKYFLKYESFKMHPPIELLLNEEKNYFQGQFKGQKSIKDPPLLVFDPTLLTNDGSGQSDMGLREVNESEGLFYYL